MGPEWEADAYYQPAAFVITRMNEYDINMWP
jgi:hypothetical protein